MPLGKNADAGDYVKDFAKSKAPQFKGKSKAKRHKMAIAAYLDARDAGKAKSEDMTSSAKKPEKVVGPDGKTRVRMVPVTRDVTTEDKMTFKVEVDGLPIMYVKGNSPGSVKGHLRKLVKQPSLIKSVDRVTKHDVKKVYRAKSQGKLVDEEALAGYLKSLGRPADKETQVDSLKRIQKIMKDRRMQKLRSS